MHLAEQFFIDTWNDPKHLIHNRAVLRACLGMIQGTVLNPEIFVISAWIHDLGKLKDKERHHIESIPYLDTFILRFPEYKQHYGLLHDCILNHRTVCKPTTIYGEIFRVADKVASQSNEWIEFKKNNKGPSRPPRRLHKNSLKEVRELRDLVRQRDYIVWSRTSFKNRIKI